ncbi:MAG: hypothetical protein WD229_08530 [Pirellulales bacterium]
MSFDGAIGPLLEWVRLQETVLLPAPDTVAWMSLGSAAPLMSALRSGRREWLCPATRAVGFFRTSPKSPENDTAWVAFGLAAQKAAVRGGFHRQTAAQFVGAMGEMVDNIYEHSDAPATGLAAFRADRRRFEFVVIDEGIGVLESLRSCREFGDLSDHGDALQLALTDGVSRHGAAAMRGHGFRPIFIGLANLSGLLRFRSGDHALTIDGQKINRMVAKTAQKVVVKGFIASVSCRPQPKRPRHGSYRSSDPV